jgi:EVE domain
MSHWILQANPRRYRLFDALRDGYEVSTWTVAQFREEIAPGDDFGLWVSGDDRGVYALGVVTERAEYRQDNDPYWTHGSLKVVHSRGSQRGSQPHAPPTRLTVFKSAVPAPCRGWPRTLARLAAWPWVSGQSASGGSMSRVAGGHFRRKREAPLILRGST